MAGIVNILVTLSLIILGYMMGQRFEKRHYRSIRLREERLASLMAVPLKAPPMLGDSRHSTLVMGSVVVSIDYFKRLAASLRSIFGGRITAYETVIDRGRREAVLRMKEHALSVGCDMVVCTRIETSRLASSAGDGKGTAAIEVLAYGTGLNVGDDEPSSG